MSTLSADATGRLRVQVARGWEFKDQATADRFLAHAIRNTVDERDFPAAWHSLEGGDELSASVGAQRSVTARPPFLCTPMKSSDPPG